MYTDSNAGINDLPRSNKVYSTVGGIVLYCVRRISLSASSSRRHFVSIVAVIPIVFFPLKGAGIISANKKQTSAR